MRYEDEFVRHKALDAIGDLYLAGGPLQAAFHGIRSGHAMNNLLLRELFADPTAWALVAMTTQATTAPAALPLPVRTEPIAALA